ncbi:MAG: ferritin [Cellulosilyticaceae bacterium]
MLAQEVVTLMNEQINKELYSAYLYLAISHYYEEVNLSGFANWFFIQAKEEQDHAMLFMKYLQNNGEHIVLQDIAAYTAAYEDMHTPLEETLEHERTVTASIDHIYEVAMGKKEFRTMQFLDWFIKEQVEEEKNAEELIKKYKLFGQDGKGLYLLDTELGARVYTPPSLVL